MSQGLCRLRLTAFPARFDTIRLLVGARATRTRAHAALDQRLSGKMNDGRRRTTLPT
jgi:hypothetical protein